MAMAKCENCGKSMKDCTCKGGKAKGKSKGKPFGKGGKGGK